MEKIKKFFLLVIFWSSFWNLSCLSQINYGFEVKCDSSYKQELNTKKVFLIGEFHNQSGNIETAIGYLNLLHQNGIYPKYWLVEDGAAYAYLFNHFLETGDEHTLSLIEDGLEARMYYREIRRYHNSLSKKNKFSIVGIDSRKDLSIIHNAIRLNIIKYFSDIDTITTSKKFPNLYIKSLVESILANNKPEFTKGKYLLYDINGISEMLIEKDSVRFNNKELKKNLREILAGFHLECERKHLFYRFESKAFKIKREQFLTNNLSRLFLLDSTSSAFGQFGIYHVVLGHKIEEEVFNFATEINSGRNNPFLKDKVSENLIWYSTIGTKPYAKLNLKLNHYINKLKNLKKDAPQITKINNRNYILLNNKNKQ